MISGQMKGNETQKAEKQQCKYTHTKAVIEKKKGIIKDKADAFNALLGSIKRTMKIKQILQWMHRRSEKPKGIFMAAG